MATLTGITVGEFGKTVTITLQDAAGTAVNISSYTTRTVELVSPSGKKLSKTAAFQTDGTNGKITFSFASGDVDKDGIWKGQVYLSKTGEQSKSAIFEVDVTASVT